MRNPVTEGSRIILAPWDFFMYTQSLPHKHFCIPFLLENGCHSQETNSRPHMSSECHSQWSRFTYTSRWITELSTTTNNIFTLLKSKSAISVTMTENQRLEDMRKMWRLFAGVARVQESSGQVLSDRDRLCHQSKNSSVQQRPTLQDGTDQKANVLRTLLSYKHVHRQ